MESHRHWPSRSHYSGSFLGRLASDWRLSVINEHRTGEALNLNTGIDNELNGENSFSFEEPNQLLKNPHGSGLNFLNPAAFGTPALGTYGNVGVYSLHGAILLGTGHSAEQNF